MASWPQLNCGQDVSVTKWALKDLGKKGGSIHGLHEGVREATTGEYGQYLYIHLLGLLSASVFVPEVQ